MNEKISIITGVRNGAEFIRQTIESVKNQNCPDVEHIVVDGASTDGTVEILKSYPHLIWKSEPDSGQNEAIEKGIRMSTGTILCILPADDILLPGSLRKVMQVFETDPSIKWLAGRCRIIDRNGREIRKWVTAYKNLLLKFHSFPLLLTECYLSAMSVFFKKEIYEEFAPFNIDEDTEYDMWLSFAKKYQLKVIPDYLSCFRIHKNSQTGSFSTFPAKKGLKTSIKHAQGHPFALFFAKLNYWKVVLIYSLINRLLK